MKSDKKRILLAIAIIITVIIAVAAIDHYLTVMTEPIGSSKIHLSEGKAAMAEIPYKPKSKSKGTGDVVQIGNTRLLVYRKDGVYSIEMYEGGNYQGIKSFELSDSFLLVEVEDNVSVYLVVHSGNEIKERKLIYEKSSDSCELYVPSGYAYVIGDSNSENMLFNNMMNKVQEAEQNRAIITVMMLVVMLGGVGAYYIYRKHNPKVEKQEENYSGSFSEPNKK